METKTVDILEAGSHLNELIVSAASGTNIVISRGNKPVARLVPIKFAQKRTAGLDLGTVTMSEDFDAPLPDDFWSGTG